LYNFYLPNALGSEQFIIAPCISAFAGSTKIFEAMALRDSLNINSLKVSNKTTLQSFLPGIENTWQGKKTQIGLNFYMPYAKTSFITNSVSEYKFGKSSFYGNFIFRYLIATRKKENY
jgi:hypothetical protein